MEKNLYIYYHKAADGQEHDDAAICEAESVHDAVEKFREFYRHVSQNEVHRVDLHREGHVPGIMIVSDY